jgi:outer membrane protein OmpA-like peptidoglycan-associated protein
MKKFIALFMISIFAAATGFADDPAATRDKTRNGAIIGGVAGGILGAVLGKHGSHHSTTRGVVVGGVVGTAAGAIIGSMMDKQERDLRQINGVDVQRTSQGELNVVVKNEVLFTTGSATLRSSARQSLRDMASVFQRYGTTTLSVQGHTDSVGTASSNERLSVERADRVASYLESLGIRSGRIDTIGYGESRPRSTNATVNGRQLNRRVEIHVLANQA